MRTVSFVWRMVKLSMDKKKILAVVRGYLLKEKRNTILTGLFLCFVTVFLLIGNQLFINVRTANRRNAEALEGKQHVTYSGKIGRAHV